MEITSLQNAKVKYWVSLHEKKVRDKEKVFLIEGDHLIKEAKKHNIVLETISINDSNADYKVTKDIMRKISSQESISSDAAVCKFLNEEGITGNILILDRIQDPGNLGTIIRSAVAFSFNSVVISNDGVDLYNPKVIRATQGMMFHINIIIRDLKEVITSLKEKEIPIYGTRVDYGSDVRTLKDKDRSKYCLIMGNEGNGVSEEILDMCDAYFYIEMNEVVESLNVGVATSIILYELNK